MRGACVGLLIGVLGLACCGPAAATGGAPDLSVAGNHFVADGQTTRLVGVNVTGPEFVCTGPLWEDFYRNGVWAYPVDDAAVAAMAGWKINAVRVPLNEDCWLGINPVVRHGAPKYDVVAVPRSRAAAVGSREGRAYRAQIAAFVARLHAHGMFAILDLHYSAPSTVVANDQYPLPDADHSIAFWRQVAAAFKADHSTAFELFNEPMLMSTSGLRDTLRWSCLRDGCTLPSRCADCAHPHPHGTFRTAGFQKLVDVIRATGAPNPILVSGRFYSNDLSRWLTFMPRDPLHQLGATFHGYALPPCHDIGCWSTTIARVAAQVPVTTTEFGSADGGAVPCAKDVQYDESLMSWADRAGVGYLAWSWWNLNDRYDEPLPRCSLGMLLDQAGTPRPGHGQAVHDHLAALSRAQGGGTVH